MSKNKELEPVVEFFVPLRLQSKQTQEQIATQTGMTLSTYQRIEQGRRDPKLSEIKRLRQYYDITWLDMAWADLNGRATNDSDLAAAMKHVPIHVRRPILALIKAVSD